MEKVYPMWSKEISALLLDDEWQRPLQKLREGDAKAMTNFSIEVTLG